MHLTQAENLLWIVETALKVILCTLVFYRSVYRRLPAFTVYASLLLAEAIVVRWTYHHWGYTSHVAWIVYWSDLGVVLAVRGIAVAELCWVALKDYPAIWFLAHKALVLIAAVLVVYAGAAAWRDSSRAMTFILVMERGLELSIAGVLLVLLGFGVRYRVWFAPVERNLIIGMAFYSTFQMVNNTFMEQWMSAYFHWWVSARVIAFELAMVIWIVPLLKATPGREPTPTLISSEESLHLLEQAASRMRRLAANLKGLGRTHWR